MAPLRDLTQQYDDYGRPIGGPDADAVNAASVAAVRQVANSAVSMPLALADRDPTLPGILGYIPLTGNAESILGLGDYVARTGTRLANAALNSPSMPTSKWGLNIPDLPDWTKTPGAHFEATREGIQQDVDKYTGGALTAPDLTTTEGQFADIIGSSMGAGVGIAPGGLANAAPRGLKTITSLLAPSLEHAPTTVPISTAVGSAQGIVDLAANASSPTPGTQVADTATPPATSVPGTDAPAQTAPQLPTPPTPPPSILFGASATPPPPDTNSVLFGSPPPGPTFTQQGNTETPLWAAGAGLVLTLGALAAGRYTHSIGTNVLDTERTARFNDPAYAQQVQDYKDDVISRGPGSGTLLPQGPGGQSVPPPLPQGNVVQRTANYVADKTVNAVAPIQNYINLTSSDPMAAERLSAMVGNTFDTSLQQNRTANFLASGYDPVSNITVPSVQGMLDDHAGFTPQQKLDFAERMRAANEIDNRNYRMQQFRAANPGVNPSLEDIAHDFFGHGTDEVQQLTTKGQNDPQIVDLAERYKQVTDGMTYIGEHPGYSFFAPSEAADMRNIRPNYVPEMSLEGDTTHPFGPRELSAATGQAQITTDPLKDLAQHVEQLYPLFERNKTNQELYSHQMDVQNLYPQSAQFMTDVQAPTGAHASYYPQSGLSDVGGQARDPITTVRTASGVKYLRVDSPEMFNVMTARGNAAARVHLGGWDTMRRLYQQGTTGIASLATGRASPLRTAASLASIAPVNAPPHMRAGLLDYGLQRMAPKGVASTLQPFARGLDMLTNLPGAAASEALGAGDRFIKRFADLVHPQANNLVNQWLRATAGDAVVDSMHQMAQNRWDASGTKWLEGSNIQGAGSAVHLDAPGIATNKASPFGQPSTIRSISAGLAPKAYFGGDWMGAKPFIINLRNAVGDFMGSINDAELNYVARLNRDNPGISPEALTYNVRNLYGNPARKGSGTGVLGKPVSWLSSVNPYTNVALQELSSTLGAIGRNPIRTSLTMATGLGSLALLSILTHMRSAAHMDFLQNGLSLQQREANVTLALSDDPNSPTEIPLPRSLRAPYAFMLDVMSKAVNTIAARHDPDVFNGVWEGLKNFLGGHITTSDALAMRHGLIDAGDVFNAPPLFGHVDWNAVAQNGISNIPSAFHSTWENQNVKQLPGQSADTALDSTTGQVVMRVLQNVFGSVAHVLDVPNEMERYHKQGNSLWDSMGMGIHDWVQTAKQSNPSLNFLWEVPLRQSVVPPIAEQMEPTLFALRHLPSLPNPAKTGFTSGNATRLPVPIGSEAPVSSDIRMHQMLLSAHGYGSRIDQQMIDINNLKAQIGAVQKEGRDPQERSQWMNQQTRVMADRYKMVQALSADMNVTLSKMAGKPVKVQDIDWSKDSSQFR